METNGLITGFMPAAHRGASRHYPENTIEAFRRALKILPRCLLEIDVRRTKDGHIVVFHDALLDLKTNGSGPVSASSLSEIKKLDAGHGISFDRGKTFPFRGRGYRIAGLEEILDAFHGVNISIDIKDNDLDAANSIISIISEKKAAQNIIIGSFHTRVVRFVRKKYPRIFTSFSRRDAIRFYLLHKLGLSFFFRNGGMALFVPECIFAGSPEYLGERLYHGIRIVTPRFIRDAHRKGIPVIIWTINNADNMRRLISWGADGIITDRPDLLKDIMDDMGIV